MSLCVSASSYNQQIMVIVFPNYRIIGAPCHPSRTVYIQSEEKGSENHSGSLTSKSSPFWTSAIRPALQSHNYQDSQAQEQFLPPGNPPYEHLKAPHEK